MESFVVIAVSIVVGLVVGVLSGLLGIGGGTVLVPVFKLGFLMDALATTATSLFTIILTSISGVTTHIKRNTCIVKLGISAGIGGAVTSPCGVLLASISPAWMIMLAAAAIIAYSSFTMFIKAIRMGSSAKSNTSKAGGAPDSCSEAPSSPELFARMSRTDLAKGFAIGLVAGVLSGYVGVGGGFLMVPLMMQFLGTPMKLTSGTSLLAVLILAVPAVIMQAALGNVNWVAGICVAIGSMPGAAIGSYLLPRVPERALRFMFSGFLLIAAVLLVINQFALY